MSRRTIGVGLCGFGVVGQGVFNHLGRKAQRLREQLGVGLEVTRIAARDPSKKRDYPFEPGLMTEDALAVATDPQVDVVCELIGGKDRALELSLAALAAGKILVTANKALLCERGAELLRAAAKGGGHLLFEASVAGGIPVIKALREGLAINEFSAIYGILNGTCNYILTRMAEEGLSYGEALAQTKRLGYAEADESLDVGGIDAAHKAVVLAYLAYGRWVPYGDLLVQGIERVGQDDIRFARESGYSIKLVAVVARSRRTRKLYVSVLPTLVPLRYTISGVRGVYNAISIRGDVVGETIYIGPGAGRDATASAVISDLLDAAKLLLMDGLSQPFAFLDTAPKGGGQIELAEPEEIESRYYLRLQVADQPGTLAEVASTLAERKVSLASVSQKEVGEEAAKASLIMTTHLTTEQAIFDSVEALKRLGCVDGEPFCMPIGEFEE